MFRAVKTEISELYMCTCHSKGVSLYQVFCVFVHICGLALIDISEQEYCLRSAAAFLIEADCLTRLTCSVALAVKIN